MERGLSQVELARRVDIHPSYLSRIEGAAWERGGPWPSDSVLRAIARELVISSTALIRLKRMAQGEQALPGRAWQGGNGRSPCAVSLGADDVCAAAARVVVGNPSRGTFRMTDHLMAGAGPEAVLDLLAAKVAACAGSSLRRVAASTPGDGEPARRRSELLAGGRPSGSVGNVETRFADTNPVVLDVLIGDHEAVIVLPGPDGPARACLTVNDPDFVAALQDWFDDSVWAPGAVSC